MDTHSRCVHSVEKAVFLLDCLWQAGGCLSLGQLSQQTGWAKSTVHGLLRAMMTSAIVEQNPIDGTYRLGYHLFELGSCARTGWDAVSIIRPHLQQVCSRLGQSVTLARRCGDDLLMVAAAEAPDGLPVPQPGARLSWHGSSLGKCILAFMEPSEAQTLLSRTGMQPLTAATVTSWADLRTQLTLIRELGYSIERGESLPDCQSIGAPIYSASGNCHYALCVMQPLCNWQSSLDRTAAACIRDAAEAASRDLGWQPREL